MTVDIARIVVLVFGILIGALGIWGMIDPRKMIGLVKGVSGQATGIIVAIAGRIILGVALIVAAPVATFPRTFAILGWIALIAAVGLAAIGRKGMQAIVNRVSRLPDLALRIALVAALLFGGALVFGVWP
jgi:hypothetical protein